MVLAAGVPDCGQCVGERHREAIGHLLQRWRAGGRDRRSHLKRARLSRIWREEAARRGIRIDRGKRMVGAEPSGGGGVVAGFDDGTVARGDLLIGCDGIHSVTRRVIDLGAPNGRYVGLTNFGAVRAGPAAVPWTARSSA